MSNVTPPNCLRRLVRRTGALSWLVVSARVLVGAVFIGAGFSKLILPPAEVTASIQQYQVIPQPLVPLIATLLPWLETASGTALLVGFYTTLTVSLVSAQLLGFSILMAVVLASGLTLEDCGCFGNLGLHETPVQVLIRDLLMLLMLVPVFGRTHNVWSLDAWGHTPYVAGLGEET